MTVGNENLKCVAQLQVRLFVIVGDDNLKCVAQV